MEKRSSYKECPKCGLRNKPSATQCDFCGQNLGPSDDWQQHIKDLESLNKMELRKPLDDRTSKRIESTIIRKDVPTVRNVGIKEAGNIGKVLKELETPPAKARDDRPRQVSLQDKLRIKEASSVPLIEKEPGVRPSGERMTIAEILKEPVKEVAPEPPAEPLVVDKEPLFEPPPAPAEEPIKDIAEPTVTEQNIPLEPEKADAAPLEAVEPKVVESNEEPVSPPVPEAPENVPAKEVTMEVVQSPPEDVARDQGVSDGEKEVAMSTTDSHETIKLKLVAVERPKEKLTPMMVPPTLTVRGKAAIAVLAVGTVAYLAVLVLTALGTLDTVTGLGGGAVSSFMIIFGVASVYPSLHRRDENEVYICPKCHETVGASSAGCPACGAEFETED